jgi:hypothetical protein
MLHSKSVLTKLSIEALTEKASELKITLTAKENKKSLIEKIMLLNEPVTAPKKASTKAVATPVKNELSVKLNGELIQQFSTTGRNVTTIERFFAKFALLADSTKDNLLIEINGHQIDYFKIRKKINKLIAAQFISVNANAVYDTAKKAYINEKDPEVKDATAYIRKAVGMTYDDINNFLTMNSKQFQERLSKDEVFADIINNSPLQAGAKKLLLPA